MRRRCSPTSLLRLAPALAILIPAAAAAQESQSALLLLQGADTVAIEQIRDTPGRRTGDVAFRAARTRIRYQLDYAARYQPVRLDLALFPLDGDTGAAPLLRIEAQFDPDSVTLRSTTRNQPPRTSRVSAGTAPNPFINPSFGLIDLALHRRHALGDTAAALPLVELTTGTLLSAGLTSLAGDSVLLHLGGTAVHLRRSPGGGLFGAVVPSQGLRIVRGEILHEAALRGAAPDYGAPPNAPYRAIDITLPGPPGTTLAGTLTLPLGARGPVPAVITVTGSGGQDRDGRIAIVRGYRPFFDIADTLSRRGIAVLRMDDRGIGGSQGPLQRATTEDFAEDIRAGIAYLRARPEIDPRQIVILGHSEGGLIAPMIAVRDSAIRGLVLLAAPAIPGRAVIETQNRDGIARLPGRSAADQDSLLRRAMHAVDSLAAIQPWLGFFVSYDPLPAARRVRVPVLLLQGDTDHQVTPDQADRLAAAMRSGGNAQVTIRHFPATNHLFLPDPDGAPSGYPTLRETSLPPAVRGAIADWVRTLFPDPI